MATLIISYVLTALGALVVVLTRLRLAPAAARGQASGNYVIGSSLVTLHTVAGGLAVLVWLAFLISGPEHFPGDSLTGVVGLFFWWVTAIAGILILTRWLPSKGRHAGEGGTDSWTEGPWLSLLGHVGMAVGVVIFTWTYLVGAV